MVDTSQILKKCKGEWWWGPTHVFTSPKNQTSLHQDQAESQSNDYQVHYDWLHGCFDF